jgi:pimeloyl-ACP methyl ester carboxylesterase
VNSLDTHSVFHLLDEITHPTLIFSGCMDVLTPAYHSFEMARRMPNAHHECYLFGTHFVLLEYPEQVAQRIAEFMASNGSDEHADFVSRAKKE